MPEKDERSFAEVGRSPAIRAPRWLAAAMVFSLLAGTADAPAAVPLLINFQGRLLQADGTPEAGILSLGFALYSAPTGGSPLWSETQTVSFAEGFYAVNLGFVSPLPLSIVDDPIYLSVTVAGTELLPRMGIASVPFALRATIAEGLAAGAVGSGSGLDADSVDGLDATDLALAAHTHPAGDADTLDGMDSSGFASATHSHGAGDADTLDGLDSTDFAATSHGHAHADLSSVGAADHHPPESGTATTHTHDNISSISGDLTISGGVSEGCSSGFAAIGGWCAENLLRGPATFASAHSACNAAGMSICPMSVLMACDHQAPAGQACTIATDAGAGTTLWTADSVAGNLQNAVNNIGVYRGDNIILAVANTTSHEYICCSPR